MQDTPLQLACNNGHERVVTSLLSRGADVSRANKENKSCLQIAIEKGHRGVVKEILASEKWRQALSEETFYSDKKPRKTPLRQLMRRMPGKPYLYRQPS